MSLTLIFLSNTIANNQWKMQPLNQMRNLLMSIRRGIFILAIENFIPILFTGIKLDSIIWSQVSQVIRCLVVIEKWINQE